MVHTKHVVRIGIVASALIFGWALLASPGVAIADTTSDAGSTASHAPKTGRAAPRPRPQTATARKVPAAAAQATPASAPRSQAARAKPVATATSANSIASDVTACACNLLKTVATYGALFV